MKKFQVVLCVDSVKTQGTNGPFAAQRLGEHMSQLGRTQGGSGVLAARNADPCTPRGKTSTEKYNKGCFKGRQRKSHYGLKKKKKMKETYRENRKGRGLD